MTEPVAAAIDGGFARPVFEAQHVFRTVMEAMARPGSVHPVATSARPPEPMTPTVGAVALTLVDHDTPLWLDTALAASEAVREWLAFHAGAPLARTPAEAHFALVSGPAELIALENFAQGSQNYPDRSATIILTVEGFRDGQALLLKGPGIETETVIAPHPMPRHFVEQWKQNRARFPRGVDLILAGPDAVACLPRTTRVTAMEG
ncbi:MAG: phosphonate C-P lyase system protein PhnH [Rhizobiaceae bacterium]|nr:phosphonate C-P lyase system protein PhnH [Rhizobiaceae bacterium]MCV0405976.1 phosphonate C-P lyase system protein PhnH [Rhizobiaceae bacterium]